MSDDTAPKKANEANEPPVASDAAAEPTKDPATEAPVDLPPQTFVVYDEHTLNDIVERRDAGRLRENFGGVHGIVDLFKVNPTTGISSDSCAARSEQWGINVLNKKEPATFLEFLIDAFGDRVVQILCGAAVISIIFGMTLENPHTGEVERQSGWIEGVAIIISVLIVTLTGSINNYQKAKKFEEMEKEQSIKNINCLRDGTEQTITSDTLCVGDIITIDTGDEMTCDCLVLKPQSLRMNEAAITGESDLILKEVDGNPFILSGTHVEEGNSVCVVIAIGMRSFQGRLKGSLDEESGDTPLQEHLEELADNIGLFGLGAAIFLVLSLSLKEIIINSTQSGKTWSAVSFLNFFLIAVALVAVAIPEGLPLAVTIALAFSMKAMMKDNCMVRVLASCETMGAATAVCSDKTGTLTTNEMTVVQGLIAGEEFVIDGYGIVPRKGANVNVIKRTDLATGLTTDKTVVAQMCKAIALNSTAREEANKEGVIIWKGNKTETAMLGFTKLAGCDYATTRTENPHYLSYPFSSLKKRMTTLLRESETATSCSVFAKGASEAILASCPKMLNPDGQIVEIDAATRATYDALIVDMASQGNRTLGVAMSDKDLHIGAEFPKEDPTDEVTLVWLGVLGIQDPIREEVPEAVRKCNTAGITVRMVTGDNIHTARAIGAKCGIYEENGFDVAMTGEAFRKQAKEDEAGLLEILPRLRILARSSPSDKHTLVGLLQKQGEVVAVTGDGTNDAPALKLSDVGFAMNSGTDIAKGAAAMILLDDNFASVVNAIRWGRAVNDNVKKFLQFQLAINIAGVFLTIVGSLASEHSKEPFPPVQMLWLNMIMDTLAALSLSTELPEESCLTRKPVYKQAPLISNHMRIFIGCHAVFQFTMILLILFLGHRWFNTIDDPNRCDRDFSISPNAGNTLAYNTTFTTDKAHCIKICKEVGGEMEGRLCKQGRIHSTMIFNIFIWFQIFNVVNARKIYGELNPLEGVTTRSQNLLFIFFLIAGLQAIAVELTGDFMQVTNLSGRNWGICIGFGALEIVVGIIVRFIPVTDEIPEEVIEREAKIAELKLNLTTSFASSRSGNEPFVEPAHEAH